MAPKNSRSIKKIKISFWLYLDGVSSRDLFLAKVDKQGVIIASKIYPESVRSEKILNCLMLFIGKKAEQKLKGFIVKQAGGSYMQVRLITSTINALAYGFKVKSVCVNDQDKIPVVLKRFSQSSVDIILPKYSGQAVLPMGL